MTYQLELTPISQIWTGNHERNSPRFLLGGFKGSLRWWYETLIRGLQTSACDPVEKNSRCSLQGFSKEQQRQIDQAAPGAERTEIIGTIVKRQICPACYLFGCTGWQSRLGLQGLGDEDGEAVQDAMRRNREKEWTCLEKGKRYTIQVKERWPFPLEPAEIAMLRLLCDFISAHGSLCARNGRKPSEKDWKNKDSYPSHVNYGLCRLKWKGSTEGTSGSEGTNINADGLQKFLSIFPEKAENQEWPDFRYLWYTDQMIDRETMNALVKRDPNNPIEYLDLAKAEPDYHRWLGGDQGVSKKIFSYHKNDLSTNSGPRSWGYSKRDENFKNRLSNDLSTNKIDIQWGQDFFRQQGLFNE